MEIIWLPFHTRAIFWQSGHHMPIRAWIRTYLTKVRSRWSRQRFFGISVSQSGNILVSGHTKPIRGILMDFNLEANGYLPTQQNGSIIRFRFPVGQYSPDKSDPGGIGDAATYLYQEPMDPLHSMLQMELLAIISEPPFPSRAIFLLAAHLIRYIKCRYSLYL